MDNQPKNVHYEISAFIKIYFKLSNFSLNTRIQYKWPKNYGRNREKYF